MTTVEGRGRAVIESVSPEIDGGTYPIKRVGGESVVVEADIFGDVHDVVECMLLNREAGEEKWSESPMRPLINDRWRGEFTVTQLGRAQYTLVA